MPTPVNAPVAGRRPREDQLVDEQAPQIGATTVAVPPPTCKTEALAQIVVYPDRWHVVGDHVVPLIGYLHLIAGVNNVEGSGNSVDPSRARAAIEKLGGKVLPFDVDGRSYVRRIKNHGGWIFRWQKVFSGSPHIETDELGFAAWLRGLVDKGTAGLQQAPAYALVALQAEMMSRLSALQGAGKDKYEAKIADVRRRLAVLERELERARLREGGPAAEVETDDQLPGG